MGYSPNTLSQGLCLGELKQLIDFLHFLPFTLMKYLYSNSQTYWLIALFHEQSEKSSLQ